MSAEKTKIAYDRNTKKLVLEMDGRRDCWQWKRWLIPYASVDELFYIFTTFQKHKVPFSSGKNWPPCEVFEYYRDRSMLKGKYLKIYWTRPRRFYIEES